MWPRMWKDKAPHLGDVNLGTFSSRHDHRLEVVVFGQGFLSRGASLVSGIVKNAVHLILEGLPQSVPRGGLQLVVVCLLDDLEAKLLVKTSIPTPRPFPLTLHSLCS